MPNATDATVQTETGKTETESGGADQSRSLKDKLTNFDSLSGEDKMAVLMQVEEARANPPAKPAPEAEKIQEPEQQAESTAEAETGTEEGNERATADADEGASEPVEEGSKDTDDDEDVKTNEDGMALVRGKRLQHLLAEKARAKELKRQLDQVMDLLKSKAETAAAAEKAETKIDPMAEIQGRIQEARTNLKKAKEDFDADAEMAASESLAEAKADLKVFESEQRQAKKQEVSRFQAKYQAAEVEHKQTRDALWAEDAARFPALRNANSELFQTVAAIRNSWAREQRNVLFTPTCDRLAVELAAAELGITPASTVKTTEAKPTTAKPSIQARKTSGVLSPPAQPSKAGQPTTEQRFKSVVEEASKTDTRTALELLAELAERQKRKR